MSTAFPLAEALERGACMHCSTPTRIVFHHEPTFKPSMCPGAQREHSRHLALRALPWLRSQIGRT